MNKIRLLSCIALGLLISNLSLVAFIIFNKPKHPLKEGPKKIIIERLHFDNQQIARYEQLITLHRVAINQTDSLILVCKNELYSTLKNNNVATKDSIEYKLGQLQIKVEEVHYNHFLEIKKLCRKDQLNNFNILINDITQLFPRTNPKRQR